MQVESLTVGGRLRQGFSITKFRQTGYPSIANADLNIRDGGNVYCARISCIPSSVWESILVL
jgi:hypothetical protein